MSTLRLLLTITIACIGIGLLPSGASAAKVKLVADDSVPLVSGNVTPLTTLPVGKPIGARFRDQYMYVTGTDGLTIYDVSDPRAPLPAGALPLPHFENEDVDLGGDILLITNDPSEGAGVLYVVDISNPNTPLLKGVLGNGFIEDPVLGVVVGFLGQPSPYPLEAGTGHTASCVTPTCSYAWLAGTSRGITIVDLRDPANPTVAGTFRPDITGLASHDVQVDGSGLAWVVGAEGFAAYDVTDPVHPVQVARSDEAIHNSGQLGIPKLPDDPVFHFSGIVGGDGENTIDLVHHDSLRLGTLKRDPPPTPTPTATPTPSPEPSPTPTPEPTPSATPEPTPAPTTSTETGGTAAPPPTSTSPSGQGTTITVPPSKSAAPAKKKKPTCRTAKQKRTKACRNAAKKKKPTCRTAKQKRTKVCRAAAKKQAAKRSTARARASVTSEPNGGSFTLEPFVQKPGKAYPAGGDSPLFGVVEEDYNRPTCKGAGSFQTWGLTDEKTSGGAAKLGLLDTYVTELENLVSGRGWSPVTGLCSAHYFDYRDGIVAGGWYEEGTRFLDVRDPTDIKLVGYWVPTKGETWSVVFPPTDPTGSVVYALDFARGIDVLELDRSDLRPRSAAVRRTWLRGKHGLKSGRTARTGLTHSSRYGYVCRLYAKR